MYHHKINTLNVATFLDLSSFGYVKFSGLKSDIEIIQNTTKNINLNSKKSYQIGDDYSYYNRIDVGFFEIYNGKKIVVYPVKGVNLNRITEVLLGFPMALCFSQRGNLVLHASCIELNGKVIMFCGQSNSGKSTLASYGLKKGAKIYSEDICILDSKNSVHPNCNYLKLSKEAVEMANVSEDNFIESTRGRHCYRIENKLELNSKVDYCFFTNWGEKEEVKNMSTAETLESIYKFAYISGSKRDSAKVFSFISSVKSLNLYITKNVNQISEVYKQISKALN